MMHWPGAKLGHFPLFNSCWEACWSQRSSLDYESSTVLTHVEWNKGIPALLVWWVLWWWLGWSTALALTQAYQIGTKLGLFANPANGSQQHECAVLCLTQASVLLLMIAVCRTGQPQPGPVTTASVKLDLPSWTMSSITGTCQACGGGGVALPSLVEVTCIFKQYWVSGQSVVSFLARELGWWMWWGATKCLLIFRASLATWWCEGVALHLDINSRLLIIQVTWSGGHWHENSSCELKLQISSFSLGAKAHAIKLKNIWVLALATSVPQWVGDGFICHQWIPSQMWGHFLSGKRYSPALSEPPDWQFKGWSQTATA